MNAEAFGAKAAAVTTEARTFMLQRDMLMLLIDD
jgi:hypothetical protein